MAEKLTFSSMTWDLLQKHHGLTTRANQALFEDCPLVEPSTMLTGVLGRARRFRLANERAKAYRLIDPVLAEVEALRIEYISTIPEMPLEVVGQEGLCGVPDFVISASPTLKALPIISIVEAKKDDIDSGLPQCAAEVYASYLLDEGRLNRVHGCVTTGLEWKFLYIEGSDKLVYIDRDTYLITELSRILGVFCHIVDRSIAALSR